MDSPRPMTEMMITTKDCRSVKKLSAYSTPREPAIDASAPIRGMPATRKPPKTSTMTSSARGRAMISPRIRSFSTWSLTVCDMSALSETTPVASGLMECSSSGIARSRSSTLCVTAATSSA